MTQIAATDRPRILDDDDRSEIIVSVGGEQMRSWHYASEYERRRKMLFAHEYVDGWLDGEDWRGRNACMALRKREDWQ